MSTSDGVFVVFLMVIVVFCFSMLGFISGQESGSKKACQSVKLEWVQDKCMKVTREAV
jgi:hypothetical protein